MSPLGTASLSPSAVSLICVGTSIISLSICYSFQNACRDLSRLCSPLCSAKHCLVRCAPMDRTLNKGKSRLTELQVQHARLTNILQSCARLARLCSLVSHSLSWTPSEYREWPCADFTVFPVFLFCLCLIFSIFTLHV